MPTVELGGQTVFYAASGQQGAPIVFVHGAGGNHSHWGLQLHALGATMQTIALDLPGHGRSAPPGRDTVDAYSACVLGLLDALAFDRAVIVGHSMGGAIAQILALTHPDRVAGLALVATGARLRVLPAILTGLRAEFEATTAFIVANSYAVDLPDALRQRALEDLRACPAAITSADYAACNQFDMAARLAEIRAPTLVVGGKQDRMTPPKYALFLAAHIPTAHLLLIDNAGHSVMIEQAEPVNRALADFVVRLKI